MWPSALNSNSGSGFFSSPSENSSLYAQVNSNFGIHHNGPQSAPNLMNTEDRSKTNLIINYLPQSFEQSDLQRLFESIGPIRQCKLIRDKTTGASLCYGFVDYMEPEKAQLAITLYHGYETDGKKLRVAYACSGGRKGPAARNGNRSPCLSNDNIIAWEVYIFGVPIEVTESDMLRTFGRAGNVIHLKEVPGHELSQLLGTTSFSGHEISSDVIEKIFNAASQPRTKIIVVIYEERKSCEALIKSISGTTNPDGSRIFCQISGPVTREMGTMMLLSSRQGFGSLQNSRPNSLMGSNLTARISTMNLANQQRFQPLRINATEVNENAIPMSSQNSSLGRFRSAFYNIGENAQIPETTFERSSKTDLPFPSGDDMGSRIASPYARNDLTFWQNCHSVEPSELKKIHSMQGASIVTPSVRSASLTHAFLQTEGDGYVEMKLENLQPSGSVTMRVMDYAVKVLFERGIQTIVVPTTGNAGVSAAIAAANYKLNCIVVVPESDTFTKARLALEAPSAKLVAFGSSFADAALKAEQIAQSANSQVFLSMGFENVPYGVLNVYNFPEIHNGYLSIVDELQTPPDVIVLPLGGGILMSGMLQKLWNRSWHSTHVVGVEPEACQRFRRSLMDFRTLPAPPGASTVASTLSVGPPAQKWLNMCITVGQQVSVITVTESEIIDATRRLAEECGLLLDPASAVAAAAVYNGALSRLQKQGKFLPNARICLLITGGRNISLCQLVEMERSVKRNHDCDPVTSGHQQPFFLKTEEIVDDLCNEDDEEKGDELMKSKSACSTNDSSKKENIDSDGGETALPEGEELLSSTRL